MNMKTAPITATTANGQCDLNWRKPVEKVDVPDLRIATNSLPLSCTIADCSSELHPLINQISQQADEQCLDSGERHRDGKSAKIMVLAIVDRAFKDAQND